MRYLILVIFGFLIINPSFSQEVKIWEESPKEKEERLSWWTNDRFGMFIHWGIYASASRHEWVKKRERLTDEDYQKYFDHFNPDLYNPTVWAKKAKAAGMKYAVITTKHHDGFCLFNSKYTDYDAMNAPIGKDLIKEWVDAFRKEGLRIGFYYSLIDWHHPDYTIDRMHPQSASNKEEYEKLNEGRDIAVYQEYLKNQVREILSNYGKIDMLWLDFSFPGEFGKGRDDWNSVELLKMVRKLQPGILINNRADLMDVPGGWDFITPEQFKLDKWPTIEGKEVPWETCQTFSGSWGYYRDETSWKNERQLLGLLIESVANGGNLLLNVGPTARGNFDYRANEALSEIGNWMDLHSRSIYGCTRAPKEFVAPAQTVLTYNPKTNRLYIHLYEYPIINFAVKNIADKIEYAQFLHDGSEVQIKEQYGHQGANELGANDVNFRLPVIKPNVEIPVIEVFLKD